MRSEKEIRDRITELKKLEDIEASDIQKMINDGETDLLELVINKANVYQFEKQVLQWVLNEKE